MSRRSIVLLKVVVWALCLAPVGLLAAKAFRNDLGANPVSEITLSTGHWTLYLLLITLAISPLRKVSHLNWLISFRRLLGLFAFFYGCLHLTTFIWLDKAFDFPEMVKDVYKRPFITAGLTAWLLMVPLAITSTAASIRWLGGKRWQRLHSLIYASAIAGVVHYWWLVKRDLSGPELMAGILSLLFAFRIFMRIQSSRRSRPSPVIQAG